MTPRTRRSCSRGMTGQTSLPLLLLSLVLFRRISLAGTLLLQRKVWGLLMGAVLVIGSAVTFMSQGFFQVLYIFFYNRGEQADLVIVGVLAAVSLSLSVAVLIRLRTK